MNSSSIFHLEVFKWNFLLARQASKKNLKRSERCVRIYVYISVGVKNLAPEKCDLTFCTLIPFHPAFNPNPVDLKHRGFVST